MFHYKFLSKAQEEFEDSVDWYYSINEEVSQNFITSIFDTIAIICEHPFTWPIKHKNFHEVSVRKFPFNLIYLINTDKNLVIITLVFHQKRNPKNKFR